MEVFYLYLRDIDRKSFSQDIYRCCISKAEFESRSYG